MWRGWRGIGLPREFMRKRWINAVKECLRKRGLDVRQARRMVHDGNLWWGFVRRNTWGEAHGINH